MTEAGVIDVNTLTLHRADDGRYLILGEKDHILGWFGGQHAGYFAAIADGFGRVEPAIEQAYLLGLLHGIAINRPLPINGEIKR